MSAWSRLLHRLGYLHRSQLRAWQEDDRWGGAADPLSDLDWQTRAVSYATSVWVYRCALAVAEAIAMVPCRIRQRNSDGTIGTVESHPAQELLARMNDALVYVDLWELTGLDLGLAGNCLWALERNATGVPVEIHRLHPRVTKPKRDPLRYVKGYEYQPNPGGRVIPIPAADVVHFQYTNPDNLTWGMAPWQAAAASIQAELDAQKHNRALMRNHAVPKYALTTDKFLDEAAGKAILRQWAQMFRGPNNAGKTTMLHSGLKVERLTLTPEEMDWIEQRRLSRREIRVAYGVPPWMVGDPDDAGDGAPNDQQLLFWDGKAASLLQKRDRILTREYLSQFPRSAGMYYESDTSHVPCLAAREQDREREKHRSQWSSLEAAEMSINQVRETNGMAPVPWGDAPWMPSGRVQWYAGYTGQMGDYAPRSLTPAPLPLGEGPLTPPPSPSGRGAGGEGRERGGEWHTRVMAAFAQSRAVPVRSMETTMREIFDRQERDALRYVESYFAAGRSRSLPDDTLVAITTEEGEKLARRLGEGVSAGAKDGAKVFALTAAFDLSADPAMLAWVAARAAELSRYADATTLAALRPKLVAALTEGQTTNQIADLVQEVFRFAKFSRAARIAQTEINRAHARGSLEQYRANGIPRKEWLSALLPTTREEHAAAHNQIVGIDEQFDLGGIATDCPGETGLPEHDINCHCAVAPVAA